MKFKMPYPFFFLLICSFLNGAAPSTYCRFVPERSDDFAWENDKVAFRAYGPALQASGEDSGFDCWLKRVDYPIINKWYSENASGKSYHKDHGEGYDPYKVGSSRGCGGLGLWLDGEIVTSNVFTKWEIIKSEPEESVFILHYEWTHGNDTFAEAKRISIKLGDRLFQSRSTFWKNGELATGLAIAVGLVRHSINNDVSEDLFSGWFSTWETIDGEGLGTGVVIEPSLIKQYIIQQSGQALNDHVLVVVDTDDTGQLEYYAGYGWAKAKEITTNAEWQSYLDEFSKQN